MVKSYKIQADNNDEYFITGRLSGLLIGNYTVPAAGGWGMEMRISSHPVENG